MQSDAPHTPDAPRTLIVVPSVLPENAARTMQWLESVRRQAGTALQCVLVANSDAVARADITAPSIDVFRPGKNLGYGESINRAARRCPGWDQLIVLNDDIETTDDSVLLPYLTSEAAEGVTVFAGKDAEAITRRGRTSFLVFARIALLSRVGPWPPSRLRHSAGGSVATLTASETASLAAFSIGRGTWERIGGFDASITHYYEDVDLLDRLHQSHQPVEVHFLDGFSHVRNASNRARRSAVFPVEIRSALAFCRSKGLSSAFSRCLIGAALVFRLIARVLTRRRQLGTDEFRSGVRVLSGRFVPVLPYDGWDRGSE